jgi:hypothetical protein
MSEEYHREAKQTKENNHWLHPTTIYNQYTALQEEEHEHQQQHNGSGNKPKPPPVYASDVTTISPLIQPLGQIAKRQYELKALPNNQIKIQPQTLDSYRTISKAVAETRTEFHTLRPKEEINYRVVLKNVHYSTNPEEIKTEIEKLGHSLKYLEHQTK